MKKSKSRYDITRKFLIFWCLFIGIGAFGGGICMLIKPDGSILQMQDLLPYFEVLPFSEYLFKDYIFSGIALIIVNGISNTIAAISLIRKKKLGIILGTLFGFTLILWICIQFYMFPMNFLDIAYFTFGLLQLITGYMAFIFYKQENFIVNEKNYKNIGKNKKELVIYFSRMGYTKKIAYEKANELGADIYEITTCVKTDGTSGFWWCGYHGMCDKYMPINKIRVDLEKYEHVTICSPIWVFNLCSPIKTFCKYAKGKVKSVSYIIVHSTNMKYNYVAKKMNVLLDMKPENFTSISCKVGKMKEVK